MASIPRQDDRRRFLTYPAVLMAWGFAGMDFLLATFAYLPTARALAIDEATYGAAVLLPMILASTVGGLALGHLADTLGRRRVLALSVALYGGSTGAVALIPGGTPGLIALALLRVVTGFGVGGVWSTAFSLIRETFSTSGRRGVLGGFNEGFFQVGFVLAGLLATSTDDLRGLYLRASFPLALAPLILFIVPESKAWLKARSGAPARGPLREILRGPWRRTLALTTGLAMAGFFTFYLFITWLPAFLLQQPGYEKSTVAIIVGAVGLGNLGATTLGGLSSDFMGRRRAFIAWTSVTIAGLAIFSISSLGVTNLLLAGVLTWSVGVGFFGIYGVWYTEMFPTQVRGTGAGFAFNVGRGASSLSPLLVSAVAPFAGLGAGMALALIPAFLMVPLALLLPETAPKRFADR